MESASLPGSEVQSVLVLSSLAKHPSRRQINETRLHPDLDRRAVTRFAADRDLSAFAGQRNGFDPLPEPSRSVSLEPRLEAKHPAPFPESPRRLAEVDSHLGWGLESDTTHRVAVAPPVPLARDSLGFEVVRADADG